MKWFLFQAKLVLIKLHVHVIIVTKEFENLLKKILDHFRTYVRIQKKQIL